MCRRLLGKPYIGYELDCWGTYKLFVQIFGSIKSFGIESYFHAKFMNIICMKTSSKQW